MVALEEERAEARAAGVRGAGRPRPGWAPAFTAMVLRQLLRFRAARSRVLNSIIFPVLWLVFFGLGWSAAFNLLGPAASRLFGGLSYLEYLAPGIIVMSVFMAGFGSGLGLIWDREFGYLRELLVSPAPRAALLLGRVVGDSLAALAQGAVMAVLVAAVAGWPGLWGFLAGLAAAYIAALASASLGSLIALSMRSPEGFHVVINLVMLPMLFLSGAFYPVQPLPAWLKTLAYLDPLYYAVDLARWAMYGVAYTSPLADAAGLAAVTLASVAAAAARFSRTYLA